jgi:hypothetical protein
VEKIDGGKDGAAFKATVHLVTWIAQGRLQKISLSATVKSAEMANDFIALAEKCFGPSNAYPGSSAQLLQAISKGFAERYSARDKDVVLEFGQEKGKALLL